MWFRRALVPSIRLSYTVLLPQTAPGWLAQAYSVLDHAVADAYGWPHDRSDKQILVRLLALNLERAAQGGVATERMRG